MIETNSLIRASAGTGKTFALATRFIRLMMFDRVRPDAIIALTFSRAAAQEIYEKILNRLAAAAKNAENAEKEWKNLLDDFRKDDDGNDKVAGGEEKLKRILSSGIPRGPAEFRDLLRRLVNAQHLGTIATIDSFLLRFYRNFPKEMGFQNAIEVIDPADEARAVEDALKRALSRKSGSREIMEAFRTLKGGDFSRTCLDGIADAVSSGWRNFLVAHPGCEKWTVESMCGALGVSLASKCPDLSMIPVNDMKRRGAVAPEAKFVELARKYNGDEPFLDDGKVGEMIRFFWQHPDAVSWKYRYYDEFVLNCGAEGAAAIRDAIRHMMNLYLRRMLEKVKANIALAKAVEDEYNKATRRAGRLTFADITQNTIGDEFSERGDAIRNVEFRFDSVFDHWALDEFQDTSELQWKRLAPFVSEAAGDGHAGGARSAMAVGDLKQSIYTWRGASSRPFEAICEWPEFRAGERDLKKSYRYGPNIAEFVNKVFGAGNISKEGLIPDVCRPAAEQWVRGWADHLSEQPADYIKVVGAVKGGGDDGESDEILPVLCEEISALWKRHEAEDSKDTVAVVVRSNTDGLKVAEYLRGRRLPAVFEGVSPVSDIPVVQALLSLMKLANHPEDTAAWKTVDELFPVREKIFPGLETAAAVSAAVSRRLSKHGFARTLKEFCSRFEGEFAETSVASERLRRFVEMGAAFEARASNGGSVDEFVSFLEASQKRETAVSSKVIRVLTIHRSKGLGFDHLFVPLYESQRGRSAIDRPAGTAPLCPAGSDGAWVLPHLKKGTEVFNPVTAEAYAKMCGDRLMESLRTYYVALTRAKKSMYVVFPEDSDSNDYGKGLLMRDLIFNAVGELPYERGIEPTCRPSGSGGGKDDATVDSDVWRPEGTREIVERTSPSSFAYAGNGKYRMTGDVLFDAGYGAAAKKGVETHAGYEKIEWADEAAAAELPAAFRPAFVKPSGDATVWRERGYEFYDDGRWETGQFDRVVFTGSGNARKAVIYDFKTNALRSGESEADFVERMKVTYSGQMDLYRRALSRLTGIAPENMRTVLLLDAVLRSVSLDPPVG
jgi:ATP-dependent exoDNAse (exonuclease V) beta subunit